MARAEITILVLTLGWRKLTDQLRLEWRQRTPSPVSPHPLPSTPYTGQKVIGVEPEATVEAACLVQSLCFMAGETETQRGFVTDQLPSW